MVYDILCWSFCSLLWIRVVFINKPSFDLSYHLSRQPYKPSSNQVGFDF